MTIERFSAMSCDVIVAGATPRGVRRAQRVFDDHEQRFSRFLATSELCRVNAQAGSVTAISDEFARVLGVALEVCADTDGLVDPTVGRAMRHAGYDRSFASGLDSPLAAGAASPARPLGVALHGRVLRLAEGVELDLNGVVKALAVDAALAAADGEWLSAGGDLAAVRPVDVGLDGGGTVRLVHGALATSGSVRRHWTRAGVHQHHLMDPRRGRPAITPWQQVTACGASCLAADAAAKAAFLLGVEGPAWLDERGVPGRFVDQSGDVLENEAWRLVTGETVSCI